MCPVPQGSADIRRRTNLGREVETKDIVFVKNNFLHDEGHYMPKEARAKEEKALKGIEDAYREGPPGRKNKAAYLLPAAAAGKSTTKISVTMRKVFSAY